MTAGGGRTGACWRRLKSGQVRTVPDDSRARGNRAAAGAGAAEPHRDGHAGAGRPRRRAEMEVNYFGTLSMCRAFAPVLAANGGGAIVNMLSVTSFYTNLIDASYGASKAAEWSLTNGVRLELHRQGTLVVAVHASFIDTDMAALTNAPKDSPESVARQALDAVEAGQVEVLADERTRTIKHSCHAIRS